MSNPAPNKGLELTARSVRSSLAPASGSSSGLALGLGHPILKQAFQDRKTKTPRQPDQDSRPKTTNPRQKGQDKKPKTSTEDNTTQTSKTRAQDAPRVGPAADHLGRGTGPGGWDGA